MAGHNFIPKRIETVANRGTILVYDAIDPMTGEVFSDGMISLDLKWIKPCTLGPSKQKWSELVYSAPDNAPYHCMMFSGRTCLVKVQEKLVELVVTMAFENLILDCKKPNE